MDLLERVRSIEGDQIIITDNTIKTKVLKTLSREKTLKSVLFLNKQDLLDKVFFSFAEHALHEAVRFCGLRPNIVEDLMGLLYMVDVDATYGTDRLIYLQALKQHLIAKDAIRFFPHLEVLFKHKTVLVMLHRPDDLTDMALQKLEKVVPVECFLPMSRQEAHLTCGGFDKTDDEIAHVAHQIRTLLDEGVNPARIKMVSQGSDYQTSLLSGFKMFGVPLSLRENHPLMRFEATRRFIEALDASDMSNLYAGMKHAFDAVCPESDDEGARKIYVKTIEALNPFVNVSSSYQDLRPLIIHALEKTTIRTNAISHAVEVTELDQIDVEETDYLFVLGCVEGRFPAFKSEDGYLSAEEKRLLGIDDAKQENERLKRFITQLFDKVPNIELTYAKRGLQETFYRSGFLKRFDNAERVHPMVPVDFMRSSYARTYDMIRTKAMLDRYDTYGEEEDDLKYLHATFAEEIIPYDNKFQGLSDDTLARLLPETLRLSYTKLNTYFKCRFRYLMEHGLKIPDIKDPLNRDLGSFFHDVLEKHLEDETLTEETLETVLTQLLERENRAYSAREMFFFRNTFETLLKTVSAIRAQHSRSNYEIAETELHLEKDYGPKNTILSGIVDKLLLREVDGLKHLVIVDYKTGRPTLKLKDGLYGMNIQLVFYVLLLKAYYPSQAITFTGFYEQCLLHKPLKQEGELTLESRLMDSLKLNGYTVDDPREVAQFDSEMETDTFIKGLKIKKDGNFTKHVKTYNPDDLERLREHLDHLIEEAIDEIRAGRFIVNPKTDQNNHDLSCAYCAFSDVCFKKSEDYSLTKIPKDDEALFEALEKGGESNDGH